MAVQLVELPSQCQTVVNNPDKYVILDTETTGLQGEILDLAMITITGKVLFNKLIKPTCPIEEGAMEIHEITEAMVAGARSFKEEWPEILAALEGRVIITYNAEFDRGRFVHTAKVHGITLPDLEWRCLMTKYAAFYGAPGKFGRPGPSWQRLAHACMQQGIDFEQEHRALSDTLATAMLIRRLAEMGGEARRYFKD